MQAIRWRETSGFKGSGVAPTSPSQDSSQRDLSSVSQTHPVCLALKCFVAAVWNILLLDLDMPCDLCLWSQFKRHPSPLT